MSLTLRFDPAPARFTPPAVGKTGAYQPVSFWQETVPVIPGPPLEGDTTCDVVILGGGFTGLSTRWELKRAKPDLDVVLLERGVVGHGASGRNGGFAMPLLGWDLHYTVKKLGERKGKAAYDAMYAAVRHLKDLVAEHRLQCDLEATGYLLLNTCAATEPRYREEHAIAQRLGYRHEWLEGAALEAHITSDSFRSGLFDPEPAIVNPAKLARERKRLAEDVGVRIFEQTPFESFEADREVNVRTPRGRVRAKQAVLALNGYGAAAGFMERRILPVHTYIVLTEPLTNPQLAEIGWAEKRTSLETARNFIHYFRLTADDRIAFGGEDAELYFGGIHRDHDGRICRDLKERFRAFFPSLRDVAFTHEWGGVLGVTLDMFPTFGATGPHGNVHYGTGYSGHGVALSNYAGVLLAPQILRALGVSAALPEESPFFIGHTPTWMPPDPLRYAGMRAYRALLRAQDRWRGA